MQASQHHSRSSMPNTLFYNLVRNFDAYSPQHCQPINPHHLIQIPHDLYCTLESSSLSPPNHNTYNSPSSVNFSPNDSSLSHQESHSHNGPYTDDDELKHKLKELETAMLGPDLDSLEAHDDKLTGPAIQSWRQMMEAVPCRDLKQILITCAMAVSNDDFLMAQWLMSELRQLVSVSGEPLQRLGAYMLEGLVARMSSCGSSIYKSLKLREPASFELLSYMYVLHEVCPYFKFGHMSANGAIAEAMRDEDSVHIIDFQIGQGSQWVPLIQAFAARPGGPPRIRMTGLDDPMSSYARGGGLNIVGRRLAKLAENFRVPFQFQAAEVSGWEVRPENLGVRPGEALAVNFAFMLHHMPDESVSTENHRDRLLRMVRGLNPKVVTLVEQELNANTAPFYPRFVEALDYYAAMFESIDVRLSRGDKERINVEQHCLARDVVNVIACEGGERVERHEPLGKWRSRFGMAGFRPYPLSSVVNGTIKRLLEKYSNGYSLEERDGALYLGWLNRDLVASCAWK